MKIHLHNVETKTGMHTYQDGLVKGLQECGLEVIETKGRKIEYVIMGKRMGGYISQLITNYFRQKDSNAQLMHSSANWSLNKQSNSVMVHDLNPLILKGFEAAKAMFQRQQSRLQNITIITPSDSVRQSVAYWVPKEPNEIYTAHHGINHELFKPTDSPVDFDYLLYAGDYRKYKKVKEGIDLAAKLNLYFIRIGPFANDAYGLNAKEYGYKILGNKFIDLAYVKRESLPKFYSGAKALWFPSSFEGFGLPPLEAAACGTPSILADTPLTRELHDNLEIPHHPKLTNHEIESAQNPYLLNRNAKRYTWEKSAFAHLEAWRKAGLLEE